MSGYIPLRNEGNSQEEEAYFALSVSTWTHHVTFLEAKALTQSSEMGKVRASFIHWISGLLCWWNSMFWYRIPFPAHSYVVTASKRILCLCARLYPWQLFVYAWIRHLTWSLEPFQAYPFSRTNSLLSLLFWLSRPHPLLRHRYQIHYRHTSGLNHTGRCPVVICDSLFPRRYDYFETRRSNGYERRGEPITNLIM
ncbi:hypothetical protein CNBF2510 [Cryptococcus deneoformans B-3501A]|uniref:hypothetical protein n=1 Tax=Cryptococcus deneoformans (strain B-3501A) TaxID=283643 RepID=UPI000042C150|nr:hypothetical protein CNBF2510 [Cryptococcus neoformans var. neoformans B-3501A]EAL20175.1 hypothetical protein CNBF2510 [Cryptococcus neoformans var. neoformans B-3501A]